MRRNNTLLTMLAVALTFGALPAFAQHGHAGGMGAGRGMEPSRGGMSAPVESRNSNGRWGNFPVMKRSITPDQLLSQDTKLSSRLQSLLPAGMNTQAAASGFKNLGQFVAAVHVSHNLGIPFSELKDEMVGSKMSLGKAIHQLRPDTNAKRELKLAKKQAKQDLKQAGS